MKNSSELNNVELNTDIDESSPDLAKDCVTDFFNGMKKIIEDNPGVYQRELCKSGYNSSTFYILEKLGYIKREKFKSSYKLFLSDTNLKPRIHLLRNYDARAKIFPQAYPNSRDMIFDYFAQDNIEVLMKHSWCTHKDFTVPYFSDEMNSSLQIRNQEFDEFLVSIGACLKFDMNKPLENIILKYWTDECDKELRKFYIKYGFFTDRLFADYKLEEILGRDRLMDFYEELEANADTFEIKWCGYKWIVINSSHIPWDYAQHLKFKWELRPDLSIKKCLYCGRSFYPTFRGYEHYAPIDIIKYYPIKNSIAELDFCLGHFPPTHKNISEFKKTYGDENKAKERMSNLLKDLITVLGYIPSYKSGSKKISLDYLNNLPIEKYHQAIKILNDMPSLEEYIKIFGNWFQALNEARLLENGVIKKSRGYICLAKDGHKCLSLCERMIDDYLFEHNIIHEKEPYYPGEKKYRADWKVGEYLIEFWGFEGDLDYDTKIDQKRDIASKYQISLIEITYSDLTILDQKLKHLL